MNTDHTPPAAETETARALLWRHGVPEDVIDGALCLHAQEVAAHRSHTPPAAWIDGHPHLEAIAATVWERCGRSDSGMCVEDDPRNIAVAALAAVVAVLPPPAEAEHQPRRGDAVEQWLKAQRDEWAPEGCEPWWVLDQALDLYRRHADTGTPLHEHVCPGTTAGRQDGGQP